MWQVQALFLNSIDTGRDNMCYTGKIKYLYFFSKMVPNADRGIDQQDKVIQEILEVTIPHLFKDNKRFLQLSNIYIPSLNFF